MLSALYWHCPAGAMMDLAPYLDWIPGRVVLCPQCMLSIPPPARKKCAPLAAGDGIAGEAVPLCLPTSPACLPCPWPGRMPRSRPLVDSATVAARQSGAWSSKRLPAALGSAPTHCSHCSVQNPATQCLITRPASSCHCPPGPPPPTNTVDAHPAAAHPQSCQ